MKNITSKNFVKLLNDHGIKNDCIININFGKEKYFFSYIFFRKTKQEEHHAEQNFSLQAVRSLRCPPPEFEPRPRGVFTWAASRPPDHFA